VNLGTFTALKTLDFEFNRFITELPESFAGLTSLVRLNMNNCGNLRTVKALPRSLRHIDLGRCKKLEHLPSFEGLTSLAILTLSDCEALKEIQGVDCLTTLEEVNLVTCTSMQPLTLQLQHKRALRSCCLSGSNVAVKYDRDWLEVIFRC
jgi:Leucine-rich repeat (LRR) protein